MTSLAWQPSSSLLLVIFLMSFSLIPLTSPLKPRFLQDPSKKYPTIQSSPTQMAPIDKTAPSPVSASTESTQNIQSSASPTMTPPTKELFPLLPFYLLMTFPDAEMIEKNATADVDNDLAPYFNYTLLENIIDTHLSFHFAQNYKNGTFISLQTSIEPFSGRRRRRRHRQLYVDRDNHSRRRLSFEATMTVVGNVSVSGITPTIISIHKIQESAFINSPLNILFEMIQLSGDSFLESIRSLSAVYSIDDISFSSFDEEEETQKKSPTTTMTEPSKKKSWNWIMILIGLLVGVMAMTTIGVILIYRQTKRNKKNKKRMETEMSRRKKHQRCDDDKDDDGVSAVSSSMYDNDNKSEYSEGLHSYAYSLEGANVPLSKYTKYPYNGDDGSLFSFASGNTSSNRNVTKNNNTNNRQNSFHEEDSVWSFGKVGVENSLSMDDTYDINESSIVAENNATTCNNNNNNNNNNSEDRDESVSSSSGDGQGEDSTTSSSSAGSQDGVENNTDDEQLSCKDDVAENKSRSLPLKKSLTAESYGKIEYDQQHIIVPHDTTFRYDQDRLKTLEERREEERLQIYGVQQQQQQQDEDTVSVDSIDKPMRTRVINGGEIVASPLHKKPPLAQKRPYSNYNLSINTNQDDCNIETNNESLAVITPDHPTPTASRHYSNPPPSTITTSPSPPSSCYSSPQRAYSSSPSSSRGRAYYNKQNYHLSDEPPLETIKNNNNTARTPHRQQQQQQQQQQYQQRYQNNNHRHTSAPHIITTTLYSSSSPSHTSHHHYRRSQSPKPPPDLREKSQIRSYSVPPSPPSSSTTTTTQRQQQQQQQQQLTPRSISPTSSYGNSSSVATPLAENRSLGIVMSKKKTKKQQPHNDNVAVDDNPVIIIDAPFDEVCGKVVVGRGSTKKSYFEDVYASEI